MRYARPTNSAASSSHADGMQRMTVKFLECGFDFERFCVPTSLHHHHALVSVSVIVVQQVVSSNNNNNYYLKILVRHFNSQPGETFTGKYTYLLPAPTDCSCEKRLGSARFHLKSSRSLSFDELKADAGRAIKSIPAFSFSAASPLNHHLLI